MHATLHTALSRLQQDQRFAEITASFNGLNLRKAYPDLTASDQGTVVRAARQRVADARKGLADGQAAGEPPPAVSGESTFPLADPTTAPARKTSEPEPHKPQPAPANLSRAAIPSQEPESRTTPTEADNWPDLMSGSTPPGKRFRNVAAIAAGIVLAGALGLFTAWDQWQGVPADATSDAQTADPGEVTPPTDDHTVPSAIDPTRRKVQDIIERHRDMLVEPPTVEADADIEALDSVVEADTPQPSAASTPASVETSAPDTEPAASVSQAASPLSSTQPLPSTAGSAAPAPNTGVDEAPAVERVATPQQPALQQPTPEPLAATTETTATTPASPTRVEAAAPLPDDTGATLTAAPASAPDVVSEPTAEPERPAAFGSSVTTPQPVRSTDPTLVRLIQTRLSAQGYAPGPIDGIMGERTANAIREFQRAKGLQVDGQPSMLLLGSLVSYSGPAGN